MALLLTEGFDHLTAAEFALKGWSLASFWGAVTGRFGGQALSISGGGGRSTNKVLPASATTVTTGFAYTSLISGHVGDITVTVNAGGTAAVQLVISGGKLTVKNSGGTTIATGTTTLLDLTWYYIELKTVINGASGSCAIQLNGVTEIATTTGNFGSSAITNITIGSTSGSSGATIIAFDDVYVCDGTGSAPNNTFLGDVRVVTVYPTGAGAHTQWQPNGAANNWDCVNEAPPNDDTDYVSDANPGDIDTYVTTDIDGGATVFGVQVNLYARKDDANVRQIAPVIRQSGTDNVGTTVTLGSSYVVYSQLYDKDPTSATWTAANVNADEFGVKEIA